MKTTQVGVGAFGSKTGVPENYEEFYKDWLPRIKKIIWSVSTGASFYEVEEIAEEIAQEFVLRESLNPEKGFRLYAYNDTKGQRKYARFNTYFFKFVRNRLSAIYRKKAKSPVSIFQPVSGCKLQNGKEARICDFLEDSSCRREEPDFRENCYKIYRHIKSTEPMSCRAGVKKDLAEVFYYMFCSVIEEGCVTPAMVAKEFGVTTQSAGLWIKDISRIPIVRKLWLA